MTISIWRYSHLALTVSSFVFILLASISGIILAFQPVSEQIQPYHVTHLDEITVAETLSVFKNKYPEVIEIKVDANDFVIASVFTENGDNVSGYFNPTTAEYLGEELKPSPFFQWVTNFHRSLFLKSVGRFFVGLCSLSLCLIAITGSILIIKRQRGIKRFFSKIIREDIYQYGHVVLGRLSVIPILIITITGVYLSLEKFDLLPKADRKHQLDFENILETPGQELSQFNIFKNTKLSEVETIEFPFSTDVEDYFTLKLHDREVLVNQLTGDILSEIPTSKTEMFSALSLNLHTGKGSILWSLILAIATLNILFFIYSGFAMTIKRRQSRLHNKLKATDAEIVILVGSENGSTIRYAQEFHRQLLADGNKVFIAEMNSYENYPKIKHLVVMTATYGQGEPPTNANKFLQKLKTVNNSKDMKFSVVGFGSLAYPDFCQFAFDVDRELQDIAQAQLSLFTVNDKSVESFTQWAKNWSENTGISVTIENDQLVTVPKQLKSLKVVEKTAINADDTFLLTLKPKPFQQIKSGDLLAIYPKNDYRERLYSIGSLQGHIQLSIKMHEHGLGSGFLNELNVGQKLKARLISNARFHFPKKASRVIMIANGTGVAPFLGMIHQNKSTETHLFLGLRSRESFELYQSQLDNFLNEKKLKKLILAFSRAEVSKYVQDSLKDHAELIAEILKDEGVVMICGSLLMYQGVLSALEDIVINSNGKPLNYYQNNQQIMSDCY